MPRKRALDPYVTASVDRHGKERFRFRRRGLDFYIAPPGSKDYKEQYRRAIEGFAPTKSRPTRAKSIGDLIERFYRSGKFLKGGPGWQKTVRGTLEPFREEFANDLIADFEFGHIEEILIRRAKRQRAGNGKVRGGTFAAIRLHEQLKRVFALAVKLKWRDDNPVDQADIPVVHETKGFHSWTEEEIARFQKRHPLGSKARLAMEIALWTGLRRADVAQLGPDHIVGGRVVTVATKTMKPVNVVALPPLLEAIAATEIGDTTFLVTDYGKPFSAAGLGNWFADRCKEAGLAHCGMHGLRKALTRRGADLGLSQQQLKALGQWSGDSEVAVYAADADRKRLADSALSAVNAWATKTNHPEIVGQSPLEFGGKPEKIS